MNFKKSTEGQMHFGTTASRKVGPAVVRNKLKRWVREYFRALPKAGPFLEADINIIFKPMDSNFYKGLRHEDFVQAMDRGVQNIRKHI
ncbi:ribonuclease P [compost metagenome]|jgi:ribonuclease P protein component